jgi:hypothetical protein
MSQAENEFTGDEDTLSVEPRLAVLLNPLIDGTPSETMQTCADIVEFIGYACDSIEHNGGANYGPTVFRLLTAVSAALKWEAVRTDLHFRRKAGTPTGGGQ